MSTQAEKIGLIRQRLRGGSGDELAIEHVPVSVIADEVGTPFYAYSGGALSDQIRRVTAALGDDVHVVFSVKSNPSLGICQLGGGLLEVLECPENGDVNGDGRTNAPDAALILQLVAGLLDALPMAA